MLIDFTVKNYRSIKEPVTLSAIAHPSRVKGGSRRPWILPDNEIAPPYAVEGRGFELLPVLGLFGANASGKSNIIDALDYLLDFMAHGYSGKAGEISKFVPFNLSPETSRAATHLELRVVIDQVIYAYNLWLDQTQVYWERLQHLLPSAKRMSVVYERKWDQQAQTLAWKKMPGFTWSQKGEYKKLRSDQPLMSYLVQAEQPEEIRPFCQWLMYRWPGTGLRGKETDKALVRKVSEFPGVISRGARLLRLLDTDVANVEFDSPQNRLWVTHKTVTGDVRWPLSEESSGTQDLIALLWRIVQALNHNTLVLADEIGAAIHPNITREIIRLFQSTETNRKRIQLIFTSHDNTLMHRNLLRRDQIWFTQKREDSSTDLYPLTDFKPRNDLATDRAYLDGRFEGVPVMRYPEDLLPIQDTEQEVAV